MSRESVLEHVMLDSRITVSVKKPDADSLVRYEIRRRRVIRLISLQS